MKYSTGRKRFNYIGLITVLLFGSPLANAAAITYEVTGKLSLINRTADHGNMDRADFLWRIVIDSDAAPTAQNTNLDRAIGFYSSASSELEITSRPNRFPDFSTSVVHRSHNIEISNWHNGTGDTLIVDDGQAQLFPIFIPGFTVVLAPDYYIGNGVSAPPIFSKFDPINASLNGEVRAAGADYIVRDLRISAVPIPAPIFLLASALTMLATAARRKGSIRFN